MARINFELKKYLFVVFSLLFSNTLKAQVSGTVFKDFNLDGTKGTASPNLDVGMSGVIIKATKPDGTALTVTYTGGGSSTNATGAYAVTGGTLGQVRLEFEMPDNYTFASNGASGGTTVLFPSAATQNLAVNYPADYCGVADPMVVTSCYVGNNAAGVNDVLVKYAYSSTGATHSASHTTIGLANQIGSTYGIGYDRATQNIYAGAFLKRHIPLKDNNADGKEDIGAIYKIPSSGSPSLWLDVTTLGVDVGMASMPTIATRALPVPATTSDLAASHDTDVFPLVGKIGLGDVEISDDNTQLFFVNLFDSKVYTVDLATKTLVGSGIAVPSACTGGVSRPFALAYHRGKLYVGVVCDASTSKLDADMKATVYRLDGASFTSVLSFPLNYTKGAAFTWGGIYGNKWNPWEDSFANVFGFISPTSLNALCEPQPILTDILFDTDESLILVLNDRLGHQTGTANFQPSTSDTKLYYGIAAGDVLRASLVSGVYTLENNGSSGGVTTAGAGNSQGPGTSTATGYTSPSGEYYVGDDENSVHQEVVAGGGAIVPGRGQVAVQVSDPAQNYFAGGTYWFNNTTGEYDKFYVVFADATMGTQPWLFGKANGLGDMEVLCNNPPIEIGNRVWDDTDKDGIQDAGEAGISGVVVTLYASNGTTVISTATTDASGNYFFSSATGTNTASAKYGLTLSFKTNYVLSFPTTSGTKSITVSNTGGNDVLDSDADAAGKVAFTTGYAGENNHSFDVGYSTCTPPTATASATQPLCTGTNAPNNGGITIAGFTAGQRYQYTSGGTFTGTATPASITAIPAGGVITSTLANTSGSYTVRIYDATDDACFVDRVVTITAVVCCTNPTAGTPVVTQATCNAAGTAANNDASISITGITNATVYAYTTDGSTPAFAGATAVSGGAINLTALANPGAATTYKFRIFNGSATCFTDVTATLNPKTCSPTCTNPVAGTPVVTQATCNAAGTAANNDASISISGITNATVYAYTTDGSTPAFAGATAVSGGAINLTGIANPASAVTYKFRIFNGSATCYTDVTATLNPKTCSPTCTNPTAGTPTVTQATCNAAGTAANNDASIVISGITNATVYAYTTDGSTPAFAGATAVSGGAINLTALANPAAATTYKIRIFNGSATCFTDVTATLNPKTCSPTCTTPSAGADMTICLPKTSLNLTDAAVGTEWVAVAGNPATAVINATTGVITGMTVTGTYKFRLQKTGDATCSDEMQVIVTAGDAVIMLCNDGSTSYTLLAQAGYTSVVWYNMAGVQVGTGTSLIVKSTTLGLEDGSEAFYYEGTNTTDGCAGELCCPVKFMTQSCCPVPNCKTVTVIKNVK